MSSSHIIESNVLVTGNQHGNQKEVYQDDDTMKPDQCCQKENAGEVLSKEETAGVQEMLNALTQEEIDSFPDDHMPLRHFRAEKGDVSKAITAIKYTIQWRKEFGVVDLVRCLEESSDHPELAAVLQKENETGKMYARGYDKDGRVLMYMRPGKENTMDETNNMRHLVFQLEKAIACSRKRNNQSKLCIVIDYMGFQLRKAPSLGTSKRTLDILQKHYPERMHRAYICNPPFVFRTFWTLIQPFIDPVTKEKICFCSGKDGMQTIVEDMGGADQAATFLEPCAGGSNPSLREFDSNEYLLQLPLNVAFDEATEENNR